MARSYVLCTHRYSRQMTEKTKCALHTSKMLFSRMSLCLFTYGITKRTKKRTNDEVFFFFVRLILLHLLGILCTIHIAVTRNRRFTLSQSFNNMVGVCVFLYPVLKTLFVHLHTLINVSYSIYRCGCYCFVHRSFAAVAGVVSYLLH